MVAARRWCSHEEVRGEHGEQPAGEPSYRDITAVHGLRRQCRLSRVLASAALSFVASSGVSWSVVAWMQLECRLVGGIGLPYPGSGSPDAPRVAPGRLARRWPRFSDDRLPY